jgi:hypothetical protein
MRAFAGSATVPQKEVDSMETLWTIVAFVFTVSVLAVVAYAFVRIATMGRRVHH